MRFSVKPVSADLPISKKAQFNGKLDFSHITSRAKVSFAYATFNKARNFLHTTIDFNVGKCIWTDYKDEVHYCDRKSTHDDYTRCIFHAGDKDLHDFKKEIESLIQQWTSANREEWNFYGFVFPKDISSGTLHLYEIRETIRDSQSRPNLNSRSSSAIQI